MSLLFDITYKKEVLVPLAVVNYFIVVEMADYSTSNFSYGSPSISPIQLYEHT